MKIAPIAQKVFPVWILRVINLIFNYDAMQTRKTKILDEKSNKIQ